MPKKPKQVTAPAEEPKEKVKKEEEKKMTVMDTEASDVLDPNKYAQIKVLSKDLFLSGALPQGYDNQYKVMAAIQVGSEMGLKPFESINSLYNVNGQFSLWGKATIRQVRKHGWTIEYTNETDTGCTASISKDNEKYSATFKYEDAVKSGYTKDRSGREKFGWSLGINRKLKLRYGALSILIKTYVPEVLGAAAGIAEIDMEAPKQIIEQSDIDIEPVIKAISEAKTLDELKEYFTTLEPAFLRDKRVLEAKDKRKIELLEAKDGE